MSEENKSEKNTNFADVLIRLIDYMYDLAQTGNLVGLVLFGFVCWVFVITYKIPAEEVSPLLREVGFFLSSEGFYFWPLSIALGVSLTANFVQSRVYKKHIQILTEHRKNLVHGLDSSKLGHLGNHNSSSFDIETDAEP